MQTKPAPQVSIVKSVILLGTVLAASALLAGLIASPGSTPSALSPSTPSSDPPWASEGPSLSQGSASSAAASASAAASEISRTDTLPKDRLHRSRGRGNWLAAMLVWISGSAGLLIASLPVAPANRISCLLGAMLVRMSLPVAGLVLASGAIGGGQGPLTGAGGYLVVHYLVALAVEVPLMLRMVGGGTSISSQNEMALPKSHVVKALGSRELAL